jgi:hypothetical protein
VDWNLRATISTRSSPSAIQVTHWRAWAASRNVRFVDGFAPFFREPAEAALCKYFIAGDVHITELGHRVLFDEVKSTIGNY